MGHSEAHCWLGFETGTSKLIYGYLVAAYIKHKISDHTLSHANLTYVYLTQFWDRGVDTIIGVSKQLFEQSVQ